MSGEKAMLLALDTETTGIPPCGMPIDDPSYPRIVEIAAVLINDESAREVALFSFVVRPDGWTIPEEVTKIHGISQVDATAIGVPIAVAIAAYTNLRAVSDELVGHNIAFDIAMVDSEIRRLGIHPRNPGPRILTCTVDLATPLLNLPPTPRMLAAGIDRPKRPSLGEVHSFLFGEPISGAHSALADARAALRCLLEMRRRDGR
jgi:DNA polymerase III subunit epsilon